MTPEQEAERIIEMFRPYMYCFLGSGMLTNTPSDKVKNMNAKECAILHVQGIIDVLWEDDYESKDYWNKVLTILKSK